jgi:hypothetical protein
VSFWAEVLRESSKGFEVTSRAALDDGTVVAEGKALLVKVGGKAPKLLREP